MSEAVREAAADEPPGALAGYEKVFGQFETIAKTVPEGPAFMLGLIRADWEHLSKLQLKQAERDHEVRLLTIWVTLAVILAITGGSVWVILAGQPLAGSVLATADLVALASVLINSIRRSQTAS